MDTIEVQAVNNAIADGYSDASFVACNGKGSDSDEDKAAVRMHQTVIALFDNSEDSDSSEDETTVHGDRYEDESNMDFQ